MTTSIQLSISPAEAVLLSNALNEILNGPDAIEDWEFHARIGATRTEAHVLHQRIRNLIPHK